MSQVPQLAKTEPSFPQRVNGNCFSGSPSRLFLSLSGSPWCPARGPAQESPSGWQALFLGFCKPVQEGDKKKPLCDRFQIDCDSSPAAACAPDSPRQAPCFPCTKNLAAAGSPVWACAGPVWTPGPPRGPEVRPTHDNAGPSAPVSCDPSQPLLLIGGARERACPLTDGQASVTKRTHAVWAPEGCRHGFPFGQPFGHFSGRDGVSGGGPRHDEGPPGGSSASGLWLRFRRSARLVLYCRQQSSRRQNA